MPFLLTEGLELVRRNWGWYLALGAVLIVLGVVALSCPLTMTLVSVVVFGWLLVFSGIAEGVMAFQMRDWGGVLLHLLGGVLEVVVGLLVLKAPLEAAVFLTLLFAVYLLVGGLFRLVFALTHRFPGSGLIAVSGAVSALLGLMVALEWPSSAVWFIGLCVGIDLVFQGASWVSFALAARRLPGPGPAAPAA
jgi:uncharacterized membrane protein HdeD (DUF308 family)